MSRNRLLGKKELNERFYSAVDPEAAFETEVQIGFHQVAVARLVAGHAASLGKRALRILELGASTCLFANGFLEVLERLAVMGEAGVEGVAYSAVEYSGVALATALRTAGRTGSFAEIEQAHPPPVAAVDGGEEVELVAELRRRDAITTELALVRADANRFVAGAPRSFDVVILNELLDDLPCRVFYADEEGEPHELAAYAYPDGPTWRVRLAATDARPERRAASLPPGTLTATSEESVRLMHGIVGLLDTGGLVLVHDYGFSDRYAAVREYAEPQPRLPPFVEVEYPDARDVPKAFFRVYGNEPAHAVQITNDVNFAEIAAALEPTGMVVALPHGNALIQNRTWPDLFHPGDGVFLSEFMLHTADDDLPAHLAALHERQRELREQYAATLGSGRTSMFTDLVYVKR